MTRALDDGMARAITSQGLAEQVYFTIFDAADTLSFAIAHQAKAQAVTPRAVSRPQATRSRAERRLPLGAPRKQRSSSEHNGSACWPRMQGRRAVVRTRRRFPGHLKNGCGEGFGPRSVRAGPNFSAAVAKRLPSIATDLNHARPLATVAPPSHPYVPMRFNQ